MNAAATVRRQIESALEQRIPGALTPRPRILRDLATTGLSELDTLLHGGLPIGAITEVVGPPCSGRTSLALTVLAQLTKAGKAVAWIDASDALDPESAAASGVDLSRQLWVRCGATAAPALTNLPQQNSRTPPGPPLLAENNRTPAPSGGCGATHPRSEVRGLSQAISAFMQPDTFARALTPRCSEPTSTRRNDRSIGTPGATNRKLIANDMEARASGQGHGTNRGGPFDWKPSFTTPRPGKQPSASTAPDPPARSRKSPEWKALDQALRATDLLLAAGGFSAIVLDLAGIPPEFAWRIPLATWFRFRAAADRARTVFLLLTQHPCARSSAELVLRLNPAEFHTAATVITGARFAVTIDRQRFETQPAPSPAEPSTCLHLVPTRKPPQRETAYGWNGTRSTAWQRPSAWARGGQ